MEPSNPDQRNVAALLDGLEGELVAEETVLLPLDGDPGVTLTGIIDLLHLTDETVEVIDYKTDLSRVAHEEYRRRMTSSWR